MGLWAEHTLSEQETWVLIPDWLLPRSMTIGYITDQGPVYSFTRGSGEHASCGDLLCKRPV